MKKTSKTTVTSGKTLVFFGNERLATGVTTTAPTLQALVDNGYKVAAVVSNFVPGRSRNARQLEIQTVAKANDIPVLLPDRPADIIDQLKSYGAAAAVLVAYGKIVPESVIDIFPKGIVNIHPSLLPLHRGPTPIENVILSGEQKTGVSVMRLVKDMDAGPVYGQSEVTLSGSESKQELADNLLEVGKAMVVELLPKILEGNVVAMPQDDSRASYDSLIKKEDGVIDWNKPAGQIEREIRAFAGWPKSRTSLAGKELIITKAHVVPVNDPEQKPGSVEIIKDANVLKVECGTGYLCIDRLKPAGKGEMTAAEFITGHKHLL